MKHTERIWNRGAPPHKGWWNASMVQRYDSWRWWDGEAWCMPCLPHSPAANAALSAQRRDDPHIQKVMQWTDYWPEGARVPRMIPSDIEPQLPTMLGTDTGTAAQGIQSVKPWDDIYNIVT